MLPLPWRAPRLQAHGVTEHTSGLIYEHSYGGINEGLSGGWCVLAWCAACASAQPACDANRAHVTWCSVWRIVRTGANAVRPRPQRYIPPPPHPHHPPDIMAQCVVDYAHENHNYAHAPDYLVGSLLFPKGVANCSRSFLRSMVEPTGDGNRSSGCWHPKFDVTVGGGRAGPGAAGVARGGRLQERGRAQRPLRPTRPAQALHCCTQAPQPSPTPAHSLRRPTTGWTCTARWTCTGAAASPTGRSI